MITRRGLMIIMTCAGLMSAGCLDRRFVVETNAPGAQIAVDGKLIGPSPADSRWEYAGYYEFNAVAPGYQPLTERVLIRAKWYEYPPFDFFTEVVYPFRIEDSRHIHLQLEPARQVNQLDLIRGADSLRERGQTLPPTKVFDETATPPRGQAYSASPELPNSSASPNSPAVPSTPSPVNPASIPTPMPTAPNTR